MDTDTAEEMADELNARWVDLDDLDACTIVLMDAGFATHLINVLLKDAIDDARFARDAEGDSA